MYVTIFIFQIYHNFSYCQLFFFGDHIHVDVIRAYFDALEVSKPHHTQKSNHLQQNHLSTKF
jgi:hypothetical protein